MASLFGQSNSITYILQMQVKTTTLQFALLPSTIEIKRSEQKN
jgi:hypothetical protein